MKIEKKYLDLLLKVTQNSKCNLKEARIRDKFIKNIVDEYKTKEEDRVKICEALCVKGKDKKPIMKNNNYQFTPENIPKFQKEFEALLSEKVTLTLLPIDAKLILKLIDNTKYEPEIGEVEIIDEQIIPLIK